MNFTFRLRYNASLGLWQVAAETSKARGRSSGGRGARLTAFLSLSPFLRRIIALALAVSSMPALAQSVESTGNLERGVFSGAWTYSPVSSVSPIWDVPGDSFHLGRQSNATLNILDGGKVTSDLTTLGTGSGVTGTATIAGVDSTWQVLGALLIGGAGTGEIYLRDGGLLSSAGTVGVGERPGGVGRVHVEGSSSAFHAKANFYLGLESTGVLDISGGGRVTVDRNAVIGTRSGASGTVNLSGNTSTFNVGGDSIQDSLYAGV